MVAFTVLIAAAVLGAAKVLLQSRVTRTLLSNSTDFVLYNAIVFLEVGTVYVLINGLSIPNGRVMLYALLYSVFNSVFQIMYSTAVKNGPVSISALLSYFSVVFTALFGFVHFHEALTALKLIGFVFFAASLILSADLKNAFKQKMSMKWLLSALGAAFTNGTATIVMTLYGKEFGTENNVAFLTVSFLVGGLMLLLLCGIVGSRKKRTVELTAKNTLSMLSVAAVLCAYLPIMMYGVRLFPSTVFFPVLNVGIISFVTVGGLVIFRDRINKTQFIGLLFGMGAIVMLAM